MRVFVAVEIPSAVRANLTELVKHFRALSPRTRWVRPENLHVTLKFIGEVEATKVGTIRAELAKVRSDAPFTLDFRSLGFFPNQKHPRVFWAGIQASPNLKTLGTDIDKVLEAVEIPREGREFSPHLTLARFERQNPPEALRAAIRQNVTHEFGSLRTNQFHLIESKLRPSGAEYTTVASFTFAAEA